MFGDITFAERFCSPLRSTFGHRNTQSTTRWVIQPMHKPTLKKKKYIHEVILLQDKVENDEDEKGDRRKQKKSMV